MFFHCVLDGKLGLNCFSTYRHFFHSTFSPSGVPQMYVGISVVPGEMLVNLDIAVISILVASIELPVTHGLIIQGFALVGCMRVVLIW